MLLAKSARPGLHHNATDKSTDDKSGRGRLAIVSDNAVWNGNYCALRSITYFTRVPKWQQ